MTIDIIHWTGIAQKRYDKMTFISIKTRFLVTLLICWLIVLGEVAQAQFAADVFTGTAGTLLTAHTSNTPASVVWTQVAGSIALDGTGGASGSATSEYYMAVTPSSADYTVTGDFVNKDASTNTGTVALWARWTGTSSFTGYYARVSSGVWSLYRFSAGAATQIGSSVTAAVAASTTYHVLESVQGSAIKLQVQRASDNLYLTGAGAWQAGQAYACSGTDANITGVGNAGLELYSASTATTGLHIANFSASYIAAAATDFAFTPVTNSGLANVASTNFTVLINGYTSATSTSIALTDGGAGGAFNPVSPLTFAGSGTTNAPTAQTFTYTPLAGTAGGTVITLTATASGAIATTHTSAYTVNAPSYVTGYTVTTPGTLHTQASVASSNFTINLTGAGGSTVQTAFTVTLGDTSSGGTFTGAGVSAGVLSIAAGTAVATTYTYTYTPAGAAGTRTLTYTASNAFTNPGNTTYTVDATPGVIAVSDTNIVAGLSPFSWDKSTAGHIIARRPGAYSILSLSVAAIGVVALNLNATGIELLTDGSSTRPQLIYSIDGAPRVVVSLTEANLGGSGNARTVSFGSLSASAHTIKWWLKSLNAGGGAGIVANSAIDVTGISVPTSSTTTVPTMQTLKAFFGGDSITEGEGMYGLASTNYPVNDDATVNYVPLVAAGLGAEYCQDGIGGISAAGYSFIFNTWRNNASTPFAFRDGNPDYFFLNLGTNGQTAGTASVGNGTIITTTGTMLNFLKQARTAAPSCKIVMLVPFMRGASLIAGLLNEFNYMQGYLGTAGNAYTSSVDPVSGATIYKGVSDPNCIMVDLGAVAAIGLNGLNTSLTATYQSFEGVHPDQRTSSEESGRILSAVRYAFSGIARPKRPGTGGGFNN